MVYSPPTGIEYPETPIYHHGPLQCSAVPTTHHPLQYLTVQYEHNEPPHFKTAMLCSFLLIPDILKDRFQLHFSIPFSHSILQTYSHVSIHVQSPRIIDKVKYLSNDTQPYDLTQTDKFRFNSTNRHCRTTSSSKTTSLWWINWAGYIPSSMLSCPFNTRICDRYG